MQRFFSAIVVRFIINIGDVLCLKLYSKYQPAVPMKIQILTYHSILLPQINAHPVDSKAIKLIGCINMEIGQVGLHRLPVVTGLKRDWVEVHLPTDQNSHFLLFRNDGVWNLTSL